MMRNLSCSLSLSGLVQHLALVSLSVGVLALAPQVSAQLTFAAPQNLTVGDRPDSLVVGDLDGDGDFDLAVANGSSTISVLLSNGNGTFAMAQDFEVSASNSLSSIQLGDLDRDGDLDVTTVAFNSNRLFVLLNNGDGTFTTAQSFDVVAAPRSVVIGDLDGDDDLDLLTGSSTISGAISVLFNRGDGTFLPVQNFVVGGGVPASVALGDTDADGDLDLVTANDLASGTVSVLRNSGNGNFSVVVPLTYAATNFPRSVKVADLDNDGDLDISWVAASSVSFHITVGSVRILLNNGNGTFTFGSSAAAGENVPSAGAIGDLDRDGDFDFAVSTNPTSSFAANLVAVSRNNGNATFIFPSQNLTLGSSSFFVTAGDVDGDGDLDLVTANAGATTLPGNTLSILENTTLLGAQTPTLTRFTPATGRIGTVVTLRTNFSGITDVQFDGVAASFVENFPGQLTVTVPAGATTGRITLTTLGGTVLSTTDFVVTATPVPTLTSFGPTSGNTGIPIVINGTNFIGVSTVQFNGLTAAFTVNSPTQITAIVPEAATTGPVTVTAAGGTVSSLGDFTVIPFGVPTLSSFTPTSSRVGTTVVLNGTNLNVNPSAVRFNGVLASFTVRSSSQIIAVVPVGATTGRITLTTSGGTATSTSDFIVLPTPAPAVTSFSPTSGPIQTAVVITGANFSFTDTTVQFNGVPASFTVDSATQLTALVPGGASTGPLTVTTFGGTATSPGNFTVLAPSNDNFGNAQLLSGTSATVTGSNVGASSELGEPVIFDGGRSVWWTWTAPTTGNFTIDTEGSSFDTSLGVYRGTTVAALTSIASNNDTVGTTSKVTLAAIAGQTYRFAIDGYFREAGNITLNLRPVIPPVPLNLTFAPASGSQGVAVILTGTNFTGVTQVQFNGQSTSFTVNSTTQITTVVPIAATTGKVTVSTSQGTVTSTTDFVVINRSRFGANEAWTNDPFFGDKEILFGDVTGDGKADAVVVNNTNITVRRSDGTAFGSPEAWTANPFFGDVGTFLADVTGDGRADLIAVNTSGTVVRRSNGTSFGPNEFWSAPFYNTDPGVGRGTFFARVSGGLTDTVVINNSGVFVKSPTGNNSFGGTQAWSTVPFYGSIGTFLADVTGDSRADIIAINADTVTVRRSDGSRFGANENWAGDFFGSRATFFGDVDGDRRADAIAINDGNITIRRSNGTLFGAYENWSDAFFGSRGTFFADVNGDSAVDAIVVNDTNITVRRAQ